MYVSYVQLTHWWLETHEGYNQGLGSIVAADALELKHRVISMHDIDLVALMIPHLFP